MERIVLPRNKPLKISYKHDFIISTKVGISRNVEALSFPSLLSAHEKEMIEQELIHVVSLFDNETCIRNIKDLEQSCQLNMLSDLVITESFIRQSSSYIHKKDGSWILLLNNKDHIQIFSIEFGLNIKEIYKNLQDIISDLDGRIHYAYQPDFGYLTSSIKHVGNGLTMSLLLNLSGIEFQKTIKHLTKACEETGYILTPFIDNNTSNLFYLKNNNSFGINEYDHIDHMIQLLQKIQLAEKLARKELLAKKDNVDFFLAQIYQLLEQNMLSYLECVNIISLVELLNNITYKIIDPILWQEQIFRLDNNSSIFKDIPLSEDKSIYRKKIFQQIFKKTVKIL